MAQDTALNSISESPGLSEEQKKKFRALLDCLDRFDRPLVAYSGGADSSFLAYVVSRTCERYLCVLSDSPTLPRAELEGAKAFAGKHGIRHRVIGNNELENERIVENDRNRCFYCKDFLFSKLEKIRSEEGFDAVFDGSNYDDLKDHRPGKKAAEEHGVRSPLIEAKMGKDDLREFSRALGLETWDKPQMACLSSRIPYGTEIDKEKLEAVEKAEQLVRELGYKNVRVRHHGDIARIEIGAEEKIDIEGVRSIVPKLKKQNFKYVVLDLEGYRTGSLNE